jgi:uncharacterized Zn-binding protein involved in type VI secretion
MPKGPAARLGDPVAHPLPGVLSPPGTGSPNVIIGGKPAWRGIPLAAVAALQAAKTTSDTTIQSLEAATLAAAGTPGAPAAKTAEETGKATAATTMGTTISSAASGSATPSGGVPDLHGCLTLLPAPPHGPGVVIDGSATVMINGLPACRQGDTILEPVGPPDKITMGEPTVIIGP